MTLSKQKIYPMVVLASCLIFSIAACNGNNSGNNNTGNKQGVSSNKNKQQVDDSSNGHYGSYNKWKQSGDVGSMFKGKNEITRDEFVDQVAKSGFFSQWDTNGDGALSKQEWNKGIDTYFSSYNAVDYGIYKTWDKNNDGTIGKDEFDNELFDFVNRNSSETITKEEFNKWFNWWPWEGGNP